MASRSFAEVAGAPERFQLDDAFLQLVDLSLLGGDCFLPLRGILPKGLDLLLEHVELPLLDLVLLLQCVVRLLQV